MKNIQWRIEEIPVTEFIPADYNPRKMTDDERRDLEASITEFGDVMPVVVNVGKRKNVLIGGHQRVTIYADLGIKKVKAVVPSRELSLAEEKRLNLRLNKNTGSWDYTKLPGMGFDVMLEVGFGDEELSMLFDDVEILDGDEQPRGVRRKDDQPITNPGDMYRLGTHLVFCGSVEIPGDRERIIGLMGTLADALYIEEQQTQFSPALSLLAPNAHVFEWTKERLLPQVYGTHIAAGLKPQNMLLWVRDDVTGKTPFRTVYQPLVYSVQGKPYINPRTSPNSIQNKEIGSGKGLVEEVEEVMTLWTDRPQEGEYKGKPASLFEKTLKRVTKPGQVILGIGDNTGALLMAGEQIQRTMVMIHTDPLACDMMIKRWEEYTNKKAKKLK